jgi:hypothetical protein
MTEDLRQNSAERKYLNLAYAAFYNVFEEVFADSFWEKESYYRLCRIKDAFSVYAELLNYPPVQWTIQYLREHRPPLEAEVGSDLFRFVRNVLAHFPFFAGWNDIWIDKEIANWVKEKQSIDRFLTNYEGRDPIKYRFWESDKKKMTYISIDLPSDNSSGGKVFLKDIISEKDGVKFSLILMKQVLDTQVESDSKQSTSS